MTNVVFHDFPADYFPIKFSAYLISRPDRIVWREVVEAPGALAVPPLAQQYGGPVGIRIEYANGEVEVQEP